MDAKERHERKEETFLLLPSTRVNEEVKWNQTIIHYQWITKRASLHSNKKQEGCYLRIKGSSLQWINLPLCKIYFILLFFIFYCKLVKFQYYLVLERDLCFSPANFFCNPWGTKYLRFWGPHSLLQQFCHCSKKQLQTTGNEWVGLCAIKPLEAKIFGH